MTGEIRIDCDPPQLRTVTERLINLIAELLTRLDYQFPQYHTMTELDKILMVEYWRKYDGMFTLSESSPVFNFDDWFVKKATEPELVRRARQLLLSRHWIFVNEDVKEHAEQAGNKFRQNIKK